MCSSDWGKEAGNVLCHELSCGSPVVQTAEQYFGDGQGLSGLKTSCVGNETSISECQLQEFKESCVDATIACMSKCHKMSSVICCHFKSIRWSLSFMVSDIYIYILNSLFSLPPNRQ